jgi:hypothetical protein
MKVCSPFFFVQSFCPAIVPLFLPREQQKWYYENLAAVFTDSSPDEQSRNLLDLFKSEVARVFGDVPHKMNGQRAMNKPRAVQWNRML